MTAHMTRAMTRDIVVETTLPHAIDVVWKTLTTAELIGKWLMPNDFKPVVGHRFNFHTRPMGDWDGVVHCEVLEVEAGRRLVYSWKGGAESNTSYGARLDTVVTWTLRETAGGTHLRMVHSGFDLPRSQAAFDAMSSGWKRIVTEAIDQVAAGL